MYFYTLYGMYKKHNEIPQVNKAVPVFNKDIINDKDLKNLIKEIESDMTVGRLLVRPSGLLVLMHSLNSLQNKKF